MLSDQREPHTPHRQLLLQTTAYTGTFAPVTHTRNLSPLYKHIFEVLPFAGVRTLTIYLYHRSSANEWADVLRPLVRVEELKIIDDHDILLTVVSALSLSPLIFPALSRLALCFGSFQWRTSITPPLLLPGLTEVAKARVQEQSRLHIAFEGCARYLPELDIALRVLTDVTWDNANFFDDCRSQDDAPWLALMSG